MYGKEIGRKFYEDGKVRRYPGNTVVADVVPGMVTFTPSGEGHSIKNTGDEDLVFIALIVVD